jgi:hypothetical protein
MTSVDYHSAAIHDLLHDPAGDVYQKTVGTTVRKTSAIAKATCPVDNGRLKSSHEEDIVDEGARLVGTVSNPVEYALPVHQGHKEIVPTKAKALAFRVNGVLVFAQKVKATKGQPWLVNALKTASPWPVVVHEEPR